MKTPARVLSTAITAIERRMERLFLSRRVWMEVMFFFIKSSVLETRFVYTAGGITGRTAAPIDIFERSYYTLLMNELLTRTVCIKLDTAGNEAILQETQVRFNEASTWLAAVCWEEGITNTNTAHHRVYGETRRRFGFGAQLAVCARAKALEAIKAVKRQDVEKRVRW